MKGGNNGYYAEGKEKQNKEETEKKCVVGKIKNYKEVRQMVKKKAEKVQQPKNKKSVQYLFRANRQKEKEREGWKKVNPADVAGEKAVARGDLVLMEKAV